MYKYSYTFMYTCWFLFTFALFINSIKNTFVIPTDLYYYRNNRMLKQFKKL